MLIWIMAAGVALGPAEVALAALTTSGVLPTPSWRWAATAAVASVGTSISFAAGWFRFGPTTFLAAWCWACVLGCILVLTDLRARRLPFSCTIALGAGGLVCLAIAAAQQDRWQQLGVASVASAVVFLGAGLIQAAAPEHTGGGDTVLYGAMSVYLGWFGWASVLRGLLFASVLTATVALTVIAVVRRGSTRFPAGPSILVGTLASLLSP